MTHPYDKHYFHGGGKVGGYAGEGYRDFSEHWNTYARVMERAPESVLELGCGRGYVIKRVADYGGVAVRGLEISEHCRLTRATDEVVTCDVTRAPWPVADREFDLCTSTAFLEHIPENDLPTVFAEMARTCRRGLHGIDIHEGDGFDQTHVTLRPLDFWKERLPPGHEAVDKEDLERGSLVLPADVDRGVKLNLGSFTHMFHGWRNLDRLDLTDWARRHRYVFTRWDLSNGLPYDEGVVDMIFMSHVLEHFTYDDGEQLLRECRRVLKPDGLIRVAVPDGRRLIDLYLAGNMRSLEPICGVDNGGSDIQMFHELLYGGDHRATYDANALLRAFKSAGFAHARPAAFRESASAVMRRETIDLYPELSLFVEAGGGSPPRT